MSDYKRMELLSLPHSDLIERVLWIESMWKESVEKRDALTATIAEKDAEIERLRGDNAWLTEKALMTPDELELMEKLKLLYEACMKADLEGELSEYIDGLILDSVGETLKILEVSHD